MILGRCTMSRVRKSETHVAQPSIVETHSHKTAWLSMTPTMWYPVSSSLGAFRIPWGGQNFPFLALNPASSGLGITHHRADWDMNTESPPRPLVIGSGFVFMNLFVWPDVLEHSSLLY